VDAGNRQQTVKTISGLLSWYRDIADEELIAAWQRDGRGNLPEVIESLADPNVAAGIVEFSWRQQRQATFTPVYAPMLGRLMARYQESAGPFVSDLLGPLATGQPLPDLSSTEAEAVCRILLDMPDLGNWKKNALQILPHYRQVAEGLLNQDLQAGDNAKTTGVRRWLADLNKVDSAFNLPSNAETPVTANAQNSRNVPSTPKPATGARSGVILTPLDPATVDHTSRSGPSNMAANIDFVNRSSSPVDIYWIDFNGNRSPLIAGLKLGATYREGTYLTHPWLIVASGTGGTRARDTGTRIAAFEAVTPGAWGSSTHDTAIITNFSGAGAPIAIPAAPTATATLIHEYKFNGNANDSAGSANGELMNGASAVDGTLTLNGANQYVQFGSHIVPTSRSYSVALFARESVLGSDFVEFISQGVSGGPGFYIGHTPAPQTIRASDSWSSTGIPLPRDDKWHCYVLVVEAPTSLSRFFVDGIQRAVMEPSIATTPNGTGTRLGRQYEPSAEYFKGNLADVQIYTGALSASDIVKLCANLPVSTPTSQVPPPGGVYKVGGGVSAPAVLTKVDPNYAEVARKLGIAGAVLLSTVIDSAGTARDLHVVKSLEYVLDEKAIEAVQKWRFRPGMRDGNAVNVRAQIEVRFSLLGGHKADFWYFSGPMTFALEAGLVQPVVKDVTMPTYGVGDRSNESLVLGFTADSSGAVKNIHSINGSESAFQLVCFRQACMNSTPLSW